LRALGAPNASAQALLHRDELTRLLQGVVQQGTGRAAALDDGTAAGKTGTSQDYRDAWFVGFNETLAVGVWVGNDDRTPMKGVTGGSLPAAIWKRFVSAATPLVGRMSAPVVAETARSAAPTKQAQCDQNACAAAYNSFRPSDCTYQPYDGPRRLCDKAVAQQDRTVAGNNASTRKSGKASPDDQASRVRPGDDLSAMSPEQRSRRAQGRMALGGSEAPPSERAPAQHQTAPPPRAFGPATFKRLEPWGSY